MRERYRNSPEMTWFFMTVKWYSGSWGSQHGSSWHKCKMGNLVSISGQDIGPRLLSNQILQFPFLHRLDSHFDISPHTAGNAIVLGAKSVLGSHFWLFFFPSFTVYFYLIYLQNISRIKLFDANLLLSGSRYISCLDYSNRPLTRYFLSTLNYSEEKGTAEDVMVGWHHRLQGHASE